MSLKNRARLSSAALWHSERAQNWLYSCTVCLKLKARGAVLGGGLRHQQTDQVVGEQVDPQLFLDHGRRQAAQYLHAERGLDAAQVELDLPATLVQLTQLCLGHGSRIA